MKKLKISFSISSIGLLFFSCQSLFYEPDINYEYSIPEKLNDGWEVSSLAQEGLKIDSIVELTNAIIKDKYKNIHSLIIVKNNKLVYENYFNGYKRSTLHNLYSASKSFNSALIGIAIDKGLISGVNEKVLPFFPEYLPLTNNDPRKEEITIKDLLTMSSGLECNDWDPKSPGQEEKVYKKKDIVKYTLNLPQVYNPGEKSFYCSSGVIILSNIISKAAGKPHPEFADEKLFAPLGITHYKWGFREDRNDRPDQVYLESRDMAKFGQLFLNKGKWQDQQLISEEWVESSLANQASLQGVIEYGYLWWRSNVVRKDVRTLLYSAQGNGGQFIFIIPSLEMIVVATGGNINSPLTGQPQDMLGRYIIPAVL